jgi:hypothetical protein
MLITRKFQSASISLTLSLNMVLLDHLKPLKLILKRSVTLSASSYSTPTLSKQILLALRH